MATFKYIVQPNQIGGWEVKKSTSSRASFVSETKKEALNYIVNLKAAEGKIIEVKNKHGHVTSSRIKKNHSTTANSEHKNASINKPTEDPTSVDHTKLDRIRRMLDNSESLQEVKRYKKKSLKELQKQNPDVDYSKPSLEVKNFTKKYKGAKIPAVEEVNFTVMPGEFHGFIGANGAGKTTTIKSLIGAYAKFEGEVSMFGHKHTTIEAKKRIGYIPEAAKFPKGMSALQYITYMSYLSGMNMAKAKKYAKEKLIEIGLEKVMKRSPNTFSSGQKKKVLLAQALVHDPDIIIMDEPAANLDPKARFEFFDDLKILQSEGKSIFISSHILAELDKFVDSVTIVDGGKIVFSGSMSEATSNPDMEYFISSEEDHGVNKIEKILKLMDVKYFQEENGWVAKLKGRENIIQLTKALAVENIVVDIFKNRKMTLEEVYNKYVLLGSRETGTGKVGKNA